MKGLSFFLVSAVAVSFGLMSCSDNTDPIVGPTSQKTTQDEAITLAKGALVHSATGSVHWKMIGFQSSVRCSFSAIQHKDGSISGQIQNNDGDQILRIHGVVFDLLVEGNSAKVCFTITKGALTMPGQPSMDLTGWVCGLVVVDNGEGKKATGPDLVSMIDGAPPGTLLDAMLTIEDVVAMNVGDYIDFWTDLYGITYNDYVVPFDNGSVQVR
jgi:hypothetical protein